jgi:CDP-glucose 4,6-dehydratase
MESMVIPKFDAPILVTGGTGFVGSHLVDSLINGKNQVVTTYRTVDRRSYFYSRHLDLKTTMVQIDLADKDSIFDIVNRFGIGYIYHLGAQAIVDTAYTDPWETIRTNIMGTTAVLEATRLSPMVKCIIVASSDKAYGKTDQKKYSETDPLSGDHPYEVSKSATDLITSTYIKTYGLPAIITRFGNIYGEGDLNFSRLIPTIMISAATKSMMHIRSDGKFVRDFLYVGDVVNGYVKLLENYRITSGNAFNFGSKETYSVLDVVNIAQKAIKADIQYVIDNNQKNEIPYQCLDFTKISKTVGWNPSYSLAETLPSIYEWYKNIL